MPSAPDTFSLSGGYESRVAQLLSITRHQARVAQIAAAPRVQDALTELEDAISDHLTALNNAAEDEDRSGAAICASPSSRALWLFTTPGMTGLGSASTSSIPTLATASA